MQCVSKNQWSEIRSRCRPTPHLARSCGSLSFRAQSRNLSFSRVEDCYPGISRDSSLFDHAMTAADFRRIALSMPQASESAHMNHPDFRVDGKIFATLGYPDKDHGMVILPPEEQARLVRTRSAVFTPAKGAWGLRGSTSVRLEAVDEATLQPVIEIAWRKRAPKRLLKQQP